MVVKNVVKCLTAMAGARSAPAIAVCLLFLLIPHSAVALVNINSASLSELTTLTGIGEVIGQRIIDARPFSNIVEIKNVKGIGEATYDKIKNDITVKADTTVTNNSVSELDSNNESSQADSDQTDYDKNAHKVPINAITLSVPTYAFVDQIVEMAAEPVAGTNNRLIRYDWNFGDATTGKGRTASHSYSRPGTYVVVVESYYLGETKIARREIEILPLELTIRRELDGSIVVSNDSSEDINVSGMKLVGQKEFVFPEHTWLLSGGEVAVGAAALAAAPANVVSLHTATGRLVTTTYQAAEASPPPPAKPRVVTTPPTPVASEVPASSTTTNSVSTKQAATVQNATPITGPTNTWPYLGLLSVIGAGLFAVYATKGK